MSKQKTKTVDNNILSSETTSKTELCFRKSGAKDWELLQLTPTTTGIKEDEERKEHEKIKEKEEHEKIGQAQESLKNMLLQSMQMQHLVVLAGSGCSYCMGGPSMSNLWDEIVENNLEEAKLVADEIKYDITENKNIEAFLSQIEAADFLHNIDIVKFLNKAKGIILENMKSFLKDKELTAHKTLLHRLSRRRIRDHRLRVFTTNYDLCFERAIANIGCIAIDGFSFTVPRRYDPRYFDYDIIRRPRSGEDSGNYLEGVFLLYKLHGSVNWENTNSNIVETENPDPQKACLIYPASGKYQQSYNQPFIESISQYLAAIREPNTCVLVMGFGFNDDHLSKPLLSAVRSNSHLRLIVVDPKIKENIENNANSHINELSELSINGEDVWFINEQFEKFVNRILFYFRIHLLGFANSKCIFNFCFNSRFV